MSVNKLVSAGNDYVQGMAQFAIITRALVETNHVNSDVSRRVQSLYFEAANGGCQSFSCVGKRGQLRYVFNHQNHEGDFPFHIVLFFEDKKYGHASFNERGEGVVKIFGVRTEVSFPKDAYPVVLNLLAEALYPG